MTLRICIVISIILSSCSVHNRMTSPEVLDKTECILTVGVSLDPYWLEDPIYFAQPVIGYRTGIAKNQELGVTLYGITLPAVVIDHKHQFLKRPNNFTISGDLALFVGAFRPIGGQYELLFGKRQLYGSLGAGYDFLDIEGSYWIVGIGTERIGNSPFGFQISYLRGTANKYYYVFDQEYEYYDQYISFGIKYDFIKTKKKYRGQFN